VQRSVAQPPKALLFMTAAYLTIFYSTVEALATIVVPIIALYILFTFIGSLLFKD